MEHLPEPLLVRILGWLVECRDLRSLACVSAGWHRLVQDHGRWEERINAHFGEVWEAVPEDICSLFLAKRPVARASRQLGFCVCGALREWCGAQKSRSVGERGIPTCLVPIPVVYTMALDRYDWLNRSMKEDATLWRFRAQTGNLVGLRESLGKVHAVVTQLVLECPSAVPTFPIHCSLIIWLIFLGNMQQLLRAADDAGLGGLVAQSTTGTADVADADAADAKPALQSIRSIALQAMWLECDHVHNGVCVFARGGARTEYTLAIPSYLSSASKVYATLSARLPSCGLLHERFVGVWRALQVPQLCP